MYCMKCGKMIRENNRFCVFCGNQIQQAKAKEQKDTQVQKIAGFIYDSQGNQLGNIYHNKSEYPSRTSNYEKSEEQNLNQEYINYINDNNINGKMFGTPMNNIGECVSGLQEKYGMQFVFRLIGLIISFIGTAFVLIMYLCDSEGITRTLGSIGVILSIIGVLTSGAVVLLLKLLWNSFKKSLGGVFAAGIIGSVTGAFFAVLVFSFVIMALIWTTAFCGFIPSLIAFIIYYRKVKNINCY